MHKRRAKAHRSRKKKLNIFFLFIHRFASYLVFFSISFFVVLKFFVFDRLTQADGIKCVEYQNEKKKKNGKMLFWFSVYFFRFFLNSSHLSSQSDSGPKNIYRSIFNYLAILNKNNNLTHRIFRMEREREKKNRSSSK